MDIKQLMGYLDISSPGEFEYFENMADLFESDYEIDADTLNELFSSIDTEILSDLIMSYFEEIMENVPDTEVELYSLLETIKLSLAGMAKHIDDESEMYGFSEEFARVHDW